MKARSHQYTQGFHITTVRNFGLAGDGGVDYETYFRLLKTAGYSGPIVAEVSAQLQRLPGYDPVAAASHCYERLARAALTAGLRRVRAPGTPG